MRVGQLRFLAWTAAVVVAASVLLTRGGSAPRMRSAPAALQGHAEKSRLLTSDGPVVLQPVPATSSRKLPSNSHLRTANVIHEPDFPKAERTQKADRQVDVRTGQEARLPVAAAASERPLTQHVTAAPVEHALSPLPLITDSNPAMAPVHAAAREHVIRGFSLGDKGAVYAARTEFIQALRIIAQAVDAQAGLGPQDAQSCSMALVRGLHALTEVEDFAPRGSRLDGHLDLAGIVAAHRTPACKASQPATQLSAMRAYFDYARNELQRAAAGSFVASQAMTGLGKSYTLSSDKDPLQLASAKGMVFHQAALTADPSNHLAANELGVLLARHGQWEPAKQALLQSLRVQPDTSAWQNLATVHRQLGERDLAQLAERERDLLVGNANNATLAAIDGQPTIQWVDPQAFAGPPNEGLPPTRLTEKPTDRAARSSGPKSWLRLK